MAIARTAKSAENSPKNLANAGRQQTSSPPQLGLKQSDIRDLGAPGRDGTKEFAVVDYQLKREVITPPPWTLEAATAQYAGLARSDSGVLRAIQAGDLPLAIVKLIQENFQLREEAVSWQVDFEELRSVSVAQQRDADARLAVADDQRLQLLEQLERTRSELVEQEGRSEQARLDYENDLETLRQQRDALEQELVDLRTLG